MWESYEGQCCSGLDTNTGFCDVPSVLSNHIMVLYIYIFDNSFIRSTKRRIKSVILSWRAGDYIFRFVFWIQVAEIICYNDEK